VHSLHVPRAWQGPAEQELNSKPPHCVWEGPNLLPSTQRASRAHQPHSGKAVHCPQFGAAAHTAEIVETGGGVPVGAAGGGGVAAGDAGAAAGTVVGGTVVGGAGVVEKNTATPMLVVGHGFTVGFGPSSFFFFLPLVLLPLVPLPLVLLSLSSFSILYVSVTSPFFTLPASVTFGTPSAGRLRPRRKAS